MPESKLSISCRRSILGEVLRKAKTPWDARAKFQEFQGTKVAAACVKATEDCPVGQNSNSGATATSDSPFRTHAIPRRLLETQAPQHPTKSAWRRWMACAVLPFCALGQTKQGKAGFAGGRLELLCYGSADKQTTACTNRCCLTGPFRWAWHQHHH